MQFVALVLTHVWRFPPSNYLNTAIFRNFVVYHFLK